MIELLTYTGPWAPLYALGLAVALWLLVMAAIFAYHRVRLDLELRTARRANRTRVERTRVMPGRARRTLGAR